VAFDPVDEVRLQRVDPDHDSACILHTGQRMEQRSVASAHNR
jgi:hypothetical protein